MELPNQEVSQGINMVNACLELQVVFLFFIQPHFIPIHSSCLSQLSDCLSIWRPRAASSPCGFMQQAKAICKWLSTLTIHSKTATLIINSNSKL